MIFHERQVNSMTFQACKMKFLNFMIIPVFHNLYKPSGFFTNSENTNVYVCCHFPPTQPAKVFLISSDSTVEQLETFCALPTYDCVLCFLTMCSVRSRENNDCLVLANGFVCILNCLSVKLFFSVISSQCNIAVKIT